MKRLISGTAVAACLMFATAPAAMAQESATGGTSASSTTPAQGTTTTPADGTSTGSTGATGATGATGSTGATDGTTTAAPASAVSATKALKLTRAQNKKIQKRVHVKADGALGARTRTAIKRYQGKKRLTRTGRPNLETIKAMKMPFATQVEQKLQSATGTAPDGTGTSVPASGDLAAAITAAQGVIGTPYASGGNDSSGFDCSGLMVYAYKAAGIKLPRTSFEQYKEGVAVEKAAIQPGDLVFFSTAGAGASHVGIATSPTTVISATTKGVMEHRIDDDYWGAAYVGARRVTPGAATSTPSR